jgi:crotonobetainyl-CoA:carnitine CoA-transferase CaiB-like acyl-CoA transferase
MTQRLAKWAAEEGHLDARVADLDWPSFPADVARGKASAADLESLVNGVTSLLKSKTKTQVDEMSRKLGLLSSAIWSMDDVAASKQYSERGLWTPVTIAPGRQIDAPARFAQFSNFTIETRRPAPALSQHTVEILASDARLSQAEIQALFVHGII